MKQGGQSGLCYCKDPGESPWHLSSKLLGGGGKKVVGSGRYLEGR